MHCEYFGGKETTDGWALSDIECDVAAPLVRFKKRKFMFNCRGYGVVSTMSMLDVHVAVAGINSLAVEIPSADPEVDEIPVTLIAEKPRQYDRPLSIVGMKM